MPDSGIIPTESEPKSNRASPQTPSSEVSSVTVPQIILTTAQPRDIHEIDNSTNQQQPSHLSTPLPLTRDLLRRKNKIDKLLHHNPPNLSTSNSFVVDERVTAGLGIATPQDNLVLGGTGLRSRRNSNRITNSADDEKIWYKSQPSTPRASDHSHFQWTSTLDRFKDSPNGNSSSKDNKLSGTSSVTSMSDNASMRAYNAETHRYMQYPYDQSGRPRHIHNHHHHHHYNHLIRKRRSQTQQYLDLIYEAAARVIHSRSPENKKKKYTVEPWKETYLSPPSSPPQHQPLPTSPSVPAPSPVMASDEVFDDKNIHGTQRHPESNDQFGMPAKEPKKNQLQGYSLNFFSPTNHIRLFLWELVKSKNVQVFIFILLLLHWLLMACVPIKTNDDKSIFGKQWTHYPILCIQSIYSLEAIAKIIVYGLWIPPSRDNRVSSFLAPIKNCIRRLGGLCRILPREEKEEEIKTEPEHKAYLNKFGNVLDLISILCYWVDFGFMLHEYRYFTLFKTMGATRPLRLLLIFPGTAIIVKSLDESLGLLLVVLGFLFFFLLLWAMIGLISFQGVFSRRCYMLDSGGVSTYVEPPTYCSGFYNGSDIIGPYNVIKENYDFPSTQGYLCKSGQICIEDPVNNPNFGFVNYDTIFYSFLSIYTVQTLEGWTPMLYQNQDGDSDAVAVYYCICVYVLSFLVTFLVFAVITSTFTQIRANNSESGFTAKKKAHPLLRLADSHENSTHEDISWKFEDAHNDSGIGVTRLWLKIKIVNMVKSPMFFYFGGLLVFLDLVFMCMRSFYASEKTLEIIDNAETAFTFIFVIEIIIRFVGAPTWVQFWSSGRNRFDLFLVISTCVIQLPMIQDSEAYKYLTIFQVLRLYRLLICFPRVRRIIYASLGNGESITNVVVFLVLATAICSPIFMQMLGGDFEGFMESDATELRFDAFWQSFMTLIMLYTSETWTQLLYNAMESQNGLGSIYAAIFTCIYFAFARFVLAGLYIAVILENFELDEEYIKQYQIKRFIRQHTHKDVHKAETILHKVFGSLYQRGEKRSVQIPRLPTSLTVQVSKSSLADLLVDHDDPNFKADEAAVLAKEAKDLEKTEQAKKKTGHGHVYTSTAFADITTDDTTDDYELIVAEENRRALQNNEPNSKSLFIFSQHSKIRYFCKRLVGNNNDGKSERKNLFNWLIMACVALSIMMVILDEPSTRKLREDSMAQSAFYIIDYILSLIFVLEIVIRVIADGLFLAPRSYLRNAWNILDFSVVIFNIVTIFLGSERSPRALSTVRSLRILRVIRYFKGVRDIFVDLFHAFPLMLDALMLTFLVLIPYSVYGINIFGGRFWLCNDSDVETLAECIGEFANNISGDDGVDANILIPRAWQNPIANSYSFDNFPQAFNHLIGLTSTEGWVDSLFSAMSTPSEEGHQPSFSWDSPMIYHSIYYITFMIISHGTVQLFVGVIIEKFKQRSGITTLTLKQRQYLDLRRQMAEIKPTIKAYRPDSIIRGWCYDIVANKRGIFNRITMGIVLTNIVIICTEYQNAPTWLENLQEYAYTACIVIYALEVLVKFLGMGRKKWAATKWNWYDGFIAISAVLLLILRFAVPDLWTLRVERYFLVFAAFRLGEGIDVLQKLYHTVANSMPSIIHVSVVFLIVMCLFAMLFMELFGLTRYGQNGDEHANFRTYGNALLLLVRMTTGEGWNYVMMDYTVEYPNCTNVGDYLDTDCGSPGWSYFLFNFFYIVCTHIFLNLFTAVIISNFEHTYETRSRFTGISKNDLRTFKHAWAEIDPNGTGYIQKKDVTKLLHHIRGNLQLGIYDDAYSIKNLSKIGHTRVNEDERELLDEKIDKTRQPSYIAGRVALGYNYGEVNNCLSKINPQELQARRKQYNLYYREIMEAERSKGISFADVLTIITYRFIDIEESLTLEPLIARLEKIERLEKAYAVEKASGVFMTLIQRKRYLQQIWLKRNEEEIKKLGVASAGSLHLDTSMASLSTPGTRDMRQHSPVPRIIVENVHLSPVNRNSIPISPMSNFSMDTQQGSPFAGLDSPGTVSGTPSPNPEDDEPSFFGTPSPGLSPHPNLSPYARHGWLMMDGNNSMSEEQAGRLMESLYHSTWSDMLNAAED
ncbi:Ion transport protein-domain-containing protein [Phycomyces nitens]|nr:Ion transport protein-domain-containing protein [Phycomyces nitens]